MYVYETTENSIGYNLLSIFPMFRGEKAFSFYRVVFNIWILLPGMVVSERSERLLSSLLPLLRTQWKMSQGM